MTADRDIEGVRDMLEHARKGHGLVAGKARTEIDADWVVGMALQRLIEVVGEAAGRVSPETRERFGDVPWGDVIGMRNRLIHGYDVIDQDVLWDTLTTDLPPLISQLEDVLRSLEAPE